MRESMMEARELIQLLVAQPGGSRLLQPELKELWESTTDNWADSPGWQTKRVCGDVFVARMKEETIKDSEMLEYVLFVVSD